MLLMLLANTLSLVCIPPLYTLVSNSYRLKDR